jgi:hypothetical protein
MAEPRGGDVRRGAFAHQRRDVGGNDVSAVFLDEPDGCGAHPTSHVEYPVSGLDLGPGKQPVGGRATTGVDDRLPQDRQEGIRVQGLDLVRGQSRHQLLASIIK